MNSFVKPSDIETSKHFWDCFGTLAIETTANLIVKMSKVFGYWKWFTMDELTNSPDNIGKTSWHFEIDALLRDDYLMSQPKENYNGGFHLAPMEYHITPKFIEAIKAYIKPEMIVKKDETMQIKPGMMVKAHDISFSVGIGQNGKLFSYYTAHNTGGLDTPFNKATLYKVVATGVKGLPDCLNLTSGEVWANDNNTIVQDVKTKEIIFIREEFLYPVEVCSKCGHTKETE